MRSIDPLMSAKSIMTVLRSPSSESSEVSNARPYRRVCGASALRFAAFALEGLCALDAELRCERILRVAGGAVASEWRRAFSAEFRPVRIFQLRTSSSAWRPSSSNLTNLPMLHDTRGTRERQLLALASSKPERMIGD